MRVIRSGQELQSVFELIPRNDALDVLFLQMIYNSFLPIPQTGKRNLLNFPDRSELALCSREMLSTLTWNERSNVHGGSSNRYMTGSTLSGPFGWFYVWLIFWVYHEEVQRPLYITDTELIQPEFDLCVRNWNELILHPSFDHFKAPDMDGFI